MPKKSKNREILLQIRMVWVKFLSFPNNCFKPSSCSISGKVQTTSEGSSRHPVLAKEEVPKHPFIPQQLDPASVLPHWGHSLVATSNQMPNMNFCWPHHEQAEQQRALCWGTKVSSHLIFPRNHNLPLLQWMLLPGIHPPLTARQCGVPQSPSRHQGFCPALVHVWITGNSKADPGWAWSPLANPLFLQERAGVSQALTGCPARVSQCRDQLQQLQPTSPLAERPWQWGIKPRCCSW